MTKKIIVASHNPVKLAAVREGFKRMFPEQEFNIQGIEANSEVSDQPLSDSETQVGAENRAKNAMALEPDAIIG